MRDHIFIAYFIICSWISPKYLFRVAAKCDGCLVNVFILSETFHHILGKMLDHFLMFLVKNMMNQWLNMCGRAFHRSAFAATTNHYFAETFGWKLFLWSNPTISHTFYSWENVTNVNSVIMPYYDNLYFKLQYSKPINK